MLSSSRSSGAVPSYKGPFAKRPSFGKAGKKIVVHANFYEVKQLPKANVYQYDVSISPEPKTKSVLLHRKLFSQLLQQYGATDLQGIRPVYDGRANMFTAREFPFAQKTFDVRLPDNTPVTGQPATTTVKAGKGAKDVAKGDAKPDPVFKVKLNRVAVIDMAELHQFMLGKKSITNNIRQGIMSLDVLIRHQPSLLFHTVASSRSFFIENKKKPLSGGLEVWQGYYQSVRPAIGRMYVNVDLSATAFFQGGPLIDVVTRFLKMRSKDDLARPMDERTQRRLSSFLKGLFFTVTHRPGSKKRFRIAKLSSKSANDYKFDADGKKLSVAQFFAAKYNCRLRFPGLPCVIHAGPNNREDFYPMEVCLIEVGQKYRRKLDEDQTRDMLDFTCKHPKERLQAIQEGLQLLNYADNREMQDFGMKVAQEMAKVNARVLSPPKITYGRNAILVPRNGTWNLRDVRVADGKVLDSWGVAVLGTEKYYPKGMVDKFIRELIIVGEATGLSIPNKQPITEYINPHGNLEDALRALWQKTGDSRKKRPQLLVCLLPSKGIPLYAEIKRISDTMLGVCTQCLQMSFMRKPDLKQYFANVTLKINAKLGGHNSFLDNSQIPLIASKPTLVVGADVTHPPAGDTMRPSIAAVIGSVDRFASRHGASIRVQDHRTERLYDLKEMMKERLKAFNGVAKAKPEQILFYRDGVSEGEFSEVMEIEVNAIRAACDELTKGYRPKITFIIVQKRHHARFFPISNADTDKSGNCPSGMVIDTDIVHPTEYDFYLQSHSGLKGTSRSAHYHVLLDEIGIGSDALHQLTFNLCHVYGRCTRTVSLVPAVYYAHLVAARARYHCKGETWTDTSETSSTRDVGAEGYGRVDQNLNPVMWFM
ncbi:eukaryotic translation initiation factor 2C, 2 [Actinomortierella ambigua]|uniref:Eukaryotic translation initiation factor 2C, 2 n=1 Tax=Actinomortierella ambigua TaxID=1343610 RepID=A0A9P6U8L9_9FUNG|nr:eukaryotic translation initiation factor 2C, 2 [Actinomortierella ambigua]